MRWQQWEMGRPVGAVHNTAAGLKTHTKWYLERKIETKFKYGVVSDRGVVGMLHKLGLENSQSGYYRAQQWL